MMEVYQNFNIENGVFKGFSAEIRVPDGVKRIAPLSLAPLYQTRCLVLPSTLETFAPSDLRKPYDKATTNGEGSYFMGNTLPRMLEEIRIPVEHPRYQSKNGALYSADGKQLIYRDEIRLWTPYNSAVRTTFRAGKNHLVLKVLFLKNQQKKGFGG